MPPSDHPYPVLCSPLLLSKVWGGDRLRLLGKDVARGATIGESWELADLSSTSASGAGGGAAHSVIRNGPLAGKTIRDAVKAWGEGLTGCAGATQSGGFPLLVKYLDARENLSVQVHPSITYARQHPGTHIKTECWYVLEADDGARIYKGVREGVTRVDFEQALAGRGRVSDLLESVPAVAGECHLLPSGTVHALGAGVLVAEVQTPSDTTFRVDDWGRLENGKPRQLHVRESMECIQWEPARDATRLSEGQRSARLVSTGFFDVIEVRCGAGERVALRAHAAPRMPVVVMLLRGAAAVHAPGCELVLMDAGDTLLLPACLTQDAELACGQDSRVLLAPVRSAG